MREFNQCHLEAIRRIIPAGFQAARSRPFPGAVVIGEPGKPGSLVIDGTPSKGWEWTVYPSTDPKSVADCQIPTTDDKCAFGATVHQWGDLVEVIQRQLR